MKDKLLLVARVSGAFGVRGELRVATFTEEPTALARYKTLLHEDGSPALTITSARAVKGAAIVRAKEVETRDEAERLRGVPLYIHRDVLPPVDEDEFYLADLIGLEVEDAAGGPIGRVKSVHDFGAGDLLEIEPAEGGATWWLPFTKEAVPELKIAEGKLIAVRPPEVE